MKKQNHNRTSVLEKGWKCREKKEKYEREREREDSNAGIRRIESKELRKRKMKREAKGNDTMKKWIQGIFEEGK